MELVGAAAALKWTRGARGLRVALPAEAMSGELPLVLRIRPAR